MKFKIKHRFSGSVLFSLETGSFKSCVEAAVKSGADLRGADLRGADLRGANLRGADLTGANLTRAYLTRAYLTGADLTRANLTGADLTGAYLTEANLRGADLRGADLTEANLSRANLTGADLTGANLSWAYLSRADLRGAKNYNPYRVDPLSLLLDQPGKIRAYKLVKGSGEGPYNGGIFYEIGKHYEVMGANTEITEQCGAGINLAALPWCMREWREGYRILLAEFTAEDIACIPHGNDGKFRVFRCKIVGEKDLKELGLIP